MTDEERERERLVALWDATKRIEIAARIAELESLRERNEAEVNIWRDALRSGYREGYYDAMCSFTTELTLRIAELRSNPQKL